MDWRKQLKNGLRDRSLTLKDVARLLNVTPGAVSHWVTGRREPSIKTLKRLAEIAGMSLDELFGDDAKYLVVDESEIALVEALRAVPDDQKATALKLLAALAPTPSTPSEDTP